MLEQFEILAKNMQVIPKPVVKNSMVKRRKNLLLVRYGYSTLELSVYWTISILSLILYIWR
jgi:hypothetical protein